MALRIFWPDKSRSRERSRRGASTRHYAVRVPGLIDQNHRRTRRSFPMIARRASSLSCTSYPRGGRSGGSGYCSKIRSMTALTSCAVPDPTIHRIVHQWLRAPDRTGPRRSLAASAPSAVAPHRAGRSPTSKSYCKDRLDSMGKPELRTRTIQPASGGLDSTLGTRATHRVRRTAARGARTACGHTRAPEKSLWRYGESSNARHRSLRTSASPFSHLTEGQSSSRFAGTSAGGARCSPNTRRRAGQLQREVLAGPLRFIPEGRTYRFEGESCGRTVVSGDGRSYN